MPYDEETFNAGPEKVLPTEKELAEIEDDASEDEDAEDDDADEDAEEEEYNSPTNFGLAGSDLSDNISDPLSVRKARRERRKRKLGLK